MARRQPAHGDRASVRHHRRVARHRYLAVGTERLSIVPDHNRPVSGISLYLHPSGH